VTGRRRVGRWFERTILGAVMSVIAFVIERRVLKAIRAKGEAPHVIPRSGVVATGTTIADDGVP